MKLPLVIMSLFCGCLLQGQTVPVVVTGTLQNTDVFAFNSHFGAGTSYTLSFNLDLNAVDQDASAEGGRYPGAVTNLRLDWGNGSYVGTAASLGAMVYGQNGLFSIMLPAVDVNFPSVEGFDFVNGSGNYLVYFENAGGSPFASGALFNPGEHPELTGGTGRLQISWSSDLGTRMAIGGVDSITTSAVPEPGTYALFCGGAAMIGAALLRRRKRLAA